MDQETPSHHEKTVRFADFARRNPAIYRLAVPSNHLRKFRNGEVLTDSSSGFNFWAAHSYLGTRLSRMRFDELIQIVGNHNRKLDARQKIRRSVGFSALRITRKVRMCRFGTHTL